MATTIITERDCLSQDDVVAEGSWRSPSHATMNLRKPRAVASDSSLSGKRPVYSPEVWGTCTVGIDLHSLSACSAHAS